MIVVPALHPAREVLARVDTLRPGTVHRTTDTLGTIGGKAVNVARFVRLMGGDVQLVVLADDAIREALAADPVLGDAGGPGGAVSTIPSPAASRIDLAIVDAAGGLTVVNGTAAAVAAADVAATEAVALDGLGRDDVIVLAGSQPPGAEGSLGRLIEAAAERGATAIVDASGPWLAEALAARPPVVKINRDESAGADTDDVPILAITDGADGIRVRIDGATWQIAPPPDIRVVNPLGAGDAVTAGLALGLAAARSPLDALRLGVAMAAARLAHLEMTLDPSDVPAIERRLRVERLA